METGKGKKEVDTRPTLDEVKQQTGRNLFVTYEGTEGGGWGIPALRPRFLGDVPEELMIVPWEPRMIAEDWLDDVRFRDLYGRIKGIKVWKTNEYPHKPDLTLPEELERSVSDARRQVAYVIATTPYGEASKEMISIENHDVSPLEAEGWENTDLYPFLECVLFYEKKLLNRKDVIKEVEARLKKIDEKVNKSSRRQRWERYGV